MRMRNAGLVGTALVSLVLVILVAGCSTTPPPTKTTKTTTTTAVPQQVSDAQYIEADINKVGNAVFLDDYKGKYVITAKARVI